MLDFFFFRQRRGRCSSVCVCVLQRFSLWRRVLIGIASAFFFLFSRFPTKAPQSPVWKRDSRPSSEIFSGPRCLFSTVRRCQNSEMSLRNRVGQTRSTQLHYTRCSYQRIFLPVFFCSFALFPVYRQRHIVCGEKFHLMRQRNPFIIYVVVMLLCGWLGRLSERRMRHVVSLFFVDQDEVFFFPLVGLGYDKMKAGMCFKLRWYLLTSFCEYVTQCYQWTKLD